MKRGTLWATILFSTILLAGCSVGQSTTTSQKQTSTIQKSSTKVSKATSSQSKTKHIVESSKSNNKESSSVTTTKWNADKTNTLANFMASWGKTMDQQYDSYSPSHNTDFYGIHYPDDFASSSMQPAVNNEKVTMGWSTDGTGSEDYQVVAIYSDEEHASFGGRHLYLFTLHDQQPLVLITEQNQGNEQNLLYFKPTANQALQNGFNQILEGQTPTVNSKESTTANNSKSATGTAPKPFTLPANMQKTWYTVNEDGALLMLTMKGNIITSTDDTSTYSTPIYQNDEQLPPDGPIHNWGRLTGTNIQRDGTSLINIRGWNQSAGDGDYYGVKSENVNGTQTDVLITAYGAGIYCGSVYYPTEEIAKQAGTQKYDDIVYDD